MKGDKPNLSEPNGCATTNLRLRTNNSEGREFISCNVNPIQYHDKQIDMETDDSRSVFRSKKTARLKN